MLRRPQKMAAAATVKNPLENSPSKRVGVPNVPPAAGAVRRAGSAGRATPIHGRQHATTLPRVRYPDSGSTRVQVSRAEHFQEERSAADGSEASQYLGFLRRELLVGEDTRRMEFSKLFKLVDEVRRLLR